MVSGRDQKSPAKDAAFQIFEELDAIDPQARGAEQETPDGPPFFCASLRGPWRPSPNGAREDLCPALESHLAKYRKLVPALALAFHLADGHHGPVGFASTLRALHWSLYLQTHARRCYGVAQSGEVDTARRILERVAKGDLVREGVGSRAAGVVPARPTEGASIGTISVGGLIADTPKRTAYTRE